MTGSRQYGKFHEKVSAVRLLYRAVNFLKFTSLGIKIVDSIVWTRTLTDKDAWVWATSECFEKKKRFVKTPTSQCPCCITELITSFKTLPRQETSPWLPVITACHSTTDYTLLSASLENFIRLMAPAPA